MQTLAIALDSKNLPTLGSKVVEMVRTKNFRCPQCVASAAHKMHLTANFHYTF